MKKYLTGCYISVLMIASSAYAHNGMEENHESKQGWFTHNQVDAEIWRIIDNQQDNIYVVEGEDFALVIDTGLGYQNLKTYVKTITDKPLVVVNSHAHPDHAGGNHDFEHVHIHVEELETLKYYTSEAVMEDTFKRFVKMPLPDHLQDKNKGSAEMLTIEEGFQFDLGDRLLEVIHIPGHSPGSIALYDNKSRNMFTGDMTTEHVWLQVKYATTVEIFLESIRKLMARKDEIHWLLPGHGDPLKPDHLDKLAAAADKLLAGECEVTPYVSPLGETASCHHEGVVIVYNNDK